MDIRQEYGNEIAQIIDALTRRKGETYTKYIERIAQDKEATNVKLADLADNTDPKRNEGLTKSLRKRYVDALQRLGSTPRARSVSSDSAGSAIISPGEVSSVTS